MSKAAGKRKASFETSKANQKRSRTDSRGVEIINLDSDEEDLGSILAQIKAQEERNRRVSSCTSSAPGPSTMIVIDDLDGDEALTRPLTRKWEREHSSGNDVVIIDVDESDTEGDEALARRLAHKWENEEKNVSPNRLRKQRTTFECFNKAPDESLHAFRDFFTGTKDCSQCQAKIPAPRGHVAFKNIDHRVPLSVVHLLHAPCSSCKTNHCRGCWAPISCAASCKGAPKKGKCSVISCCAGSRAIAMFETLGGLDRHFIDQRATAASRAEVALSKTMDKTSNSVGLGGTGYSTGRPSGRGSGPSSGKNASEKHWDELVVRAFQALTDLLPEPYSDSAQSYDLIPHPSIGMLLSLSRLPELLTSLLRNDSVTDWTERGVTYSTMLLLLRRMADCELTVQVLLERRWEVLNGSGIEPWMWGEEDIAWRRNEHGLIERGPPLFEYFKRLTKQSETFMTTISRTFDTEPSTDADDVHIAMTQAVSLCGDIIAAESDIERVIAILGISVNVDDREVAKGKADADRSSSEFITAYAKACERLALRHVELGSSPAEGNGTGLVYQNFKYAQNLTQTANSIRNPRSQFRLASELATLATSLPPGVWVRVDEVRNDAIKFMIAGPEETPYEGGLFEFDCFMPLDYPSCPPLVNLCTTGKGTVRFNPNLYNCGKVCLSLLGTWSGGASEKWNAKSTLLQVIVSIQSMILIDLPYFNEPGYGKANPTFSASIEYNRQISKHTARWAILDWLQEEHLSGIWGEVIVSHFGIKKQRIRERLISWMADYRSQKTRGKVAEGNLPSMYTGVPLYPMNTEVSPKINDLDFVEEFNKRIQLVDDQLDAL